jgi:hypothetical protein
MNLLFKFSFIISGLFFRLIIFENFMQVSGLLLLLFIAVTLYQYLYVFIFYKRDNSEMSHAACLARWALCYSITIEIMIAITMILNFNFNRTMAQGIFTTNASSANPYTLPLILSTCIAFQIIYYIIKRLKKPK